MRASDTTTTMSTDSATATLAQRLRVLSEPLRLRLLLQLRGGEQTVTRLAQQLGTSQPNVSKHLKVLLDHDLVTRRQQRNSAYYAVANAAVWDVIEAAQRSLGAST